MGFIHLLRLLAMPGDVKVARFHLAPKTSLRDGVLLVPCSWCSNHLFSYILMIGRLSPPVIRSTHAGGLTVPCSPPINKSGSAKIVANATWRASLDPTQPLYLACAVPLRRLGFALIDRHLLSPHAGCGSVCWAPVCKLSDWPDFRRLLYAYQ